MIGGNQKKQLSFILWLARELKLNEKPSPDHLSSILRGVLVYSCPILGNILHSENRRFHFFLKNQIKELLVPFIGRLLHWIQLLEVLPY
jgi:hypothetical protein